MFYPLGLFESKATIKNKVDKTMLLRYLHRHYEQINDDIAETLSEIIEDLENIG